MLRALHHDGVHDDRCPPAADHLAGDSVLTSPGTLDRRHHRARLPEEGRRCSAKPARGAAVLRPHRSRDRGADPGARTGDGGRRRKRPRREQGALLARVVGEARALATRTRPRSCAGCSAGTTRGSTSRSARSECSSGLTGTSPREPEVHDSHLEEVRSGHSQEPLEAHEPKIGGPVTGRAHGRARARYPTAVLSWVGPDGFPLAVRTSVAVDRDARRVGLERTGRAPRWSRGPRASRRMHTTPAQLAGELPGPRRPRPRQRRLDACAAPPLGGFELPDESELARYRRNFSKTIRFCRNARRRRRSG